MNPEGTIDSQGRCCVPGCKPYWYAQRTYTAECSEGTVGDAVTKTCSYKSYTSQEHAEAQALVLAKQCAELELQCYFRQTACSQAECDVVIAHVLSNFEADLTVQYRHLRPLIPQPGTSVVLKLPTAETIGADVVSTFEDHTIIISVNPGFALPAGTEVIQQPIICCDIDSQVSAEDALDRARECSRAQAYYVCKNDALLPIGHFFL